MSGKPRPVFSLVVIAILGVAVGVSWRELSRLDFTEIPTRATWQLTDRVVETLGLEVGGQVADLGTGGGYFTFPLAEAVGPSGSVYAVDIDEIELNALEREIEAKEIANVVAVHGQLDDPLLPDGSIDLVFVCNTYHHIESRITYFSRLRDDLSSGGRVAILEPRAGITGIARLFTQREHSTERASLLLEMEAAGYRHIESHDFLPVQLFEIFESKPRTSTHGSSFRKERRVDPRDDPESILVVELFQHLVG